MNKEIKEVLERAIPGDLIEFNRKIYSHWAVYEENGKIIHLTSDDIWSSDKWTVVKRSNLGDVVGSSLLPDGVSVFVSINNSKDTLYRPLNSDEIVRRARNMIGFRGYGLLSYNCESFASYCRYGVPFSLQVVTLLTRVVASTAGVTVGLLMKEAIHYTIVTTVAATVSTGYVLVFAAATAYMVYVLIRHSSVVYSIIRRITEKIGQFSLEGWVKKLIGTILIAAAVGVLLYMSYIVLSSEIVKAGLHAVIDFITPWVKQVLNMCMKLIRLMCKYIKVLVRSGWNFIKAFMRSWWNYIKDFMGSCWNCVKTLIGRGWNFIKAFMRSGWNFIKDLMVSGLNCVKNLVRKGWNCVKALVGRGWNCVKNLVGRGWNCVKTLVARGWNCVKNLVGRGLSLIRSGWICLRDSTRLAWNCIKNFFGSGCNVIKNVLKAGWNCMKELFTLNGMKGFIASGCNYISRSVKSGLNKCVDLVRSGWNYIKNCFSSGSDPCAESVSTDVDFYDELLRFLLVYSVSSRDGPLIMPSFIGFAVAMRAVIYTILTPSNTLPLS